MPSHQLMSLVSAPPSSMSLLKVFSRSRHCRFYSKSLYATYFFSIFSSFGKKGVVFDLSDRDLFCIEDHDVFDRVYSLVKGFSFLSPSSKYYLVETIRSNLAVLLPNVDSLARAPQSSPSNSGNDQVPLSERIAVHRNALKIYTYFLITIVLVQEPKQDTCTASKVIM